MVDDIVKRFRDGETEETIRIAAATIFSKEVIRLMENDNISAIDALAAACETHQIEEEDVVSLLTPKLINIIQKDSEDRNLLKKPHTTPRLF